MPAERYAITVNSLIVAVYGVPRRLATCSDSNGRFWETRSCNVQGPPCVTKPFWFDFGFPNRSRISAFSLQRQRRLSRPTHKIAGV